MTGVQTCALPICILNIAGESPRALAVSPDGAKVYVAIFESGNRSTIVGGGSDESGTIVFPPNGVNDALGPHGGQNPPFNGNGQFIPPLAPDLPPPPPTDLIVKQDAGGVWRDDTGADWSRFVSGADAPASGRVTGWHLPDNDVATDRKSTRLNSSHIPLSRMPSSA